MTSKKTNNGKIFLLSGGEEAEVYNILPEYNTYWWTRSTSFSSKHLAWRVNPSGRWSYGVADSACGVVPACIFDLRYLTIFQEEDNIIFESKN